MNLETSLSYGGLLWLLAGCGGGADSDDLFNGAGGATSGSSATASSAAETDTASSGGSSSTSDTSTTTGGAGSDTTSAVVDTTNSSSASAGGSSSTETSAGGTSAGGTSAGGVGGNTTSAVSVGTSAGMGGTTGSTMTSNTSDTSSDATSSTGTMTTTGVATTGANCVPVDETCDGQDNNCDDVVDDAEACPTGCHGATFEGHVYVFCDAPPGTGGGARPERNWQQAQQYCMDRGQLLVSLETEEESVFVYEQLNLASAEGDVWMGATDQKEDEVWSWVLGETRESWVEFFDADSGEPINNSFVDWREGEPNDQGGEHCGLIEAQGDGEWLWDDESCQTGLDRLVCEGH